jgi:hypothetical protein
MSELFGRKMRVGSRTDREISHASFLAGLFVLSAATLMYEIVLTRLLSVVSWYYLAFVAVSTAMLGMTAGALAVQIGKDFFAHEQIPRRLAQAAFAAAGSMPAALVLMLAVPVDISFALESVFVFVLFSAIIAVPFFFSGVAVCLSLTRSPLRTGVVYCVDLLGAAAGCFGSLALLELLDAPSAIFIISGLLFLSAIAYASYAHETIQVRRGIACGAAVVVLALLNASTFHGIQPIWSRGKIDHRMHILAEVWNPISRVRASEPYRNVAPFLFGPSAKMPDIRSDWIDLSVDTFADTTLLGFQGNDPSQFDFLRYDVTSLAYSLRKGGSAAIIGLGGARDALTAWSNGFHRIVGIEINKGLIDLVMRRLRWFADLGRIPGLEVHADEGRSYIGRSTDKYDVIQASMIDTEAATSAGAMTLSENSLYTVEAWRIFYQHLRPGGFLTFTRWAGPGPTLVETLRIFSSAWATLLAQGVSNPGDCIALVRSGPVATLLLRKGPFNPGDLGMIRKIAHEMEFEILYLPGEPPQLPELRKVTAARTPADLSHLWYLGALDYSPVSDASPFFFSFVRLSTLFRVAKASAAGSIVSGSVVALASLLCFMLAGVFLLALVIVIPLTRWVGLPVRRDATMGFGIVYFTTIGLGFMLVEISMMQQLSLLLGHPNYSLAVVLAGLVFFSGLGSLASEKIPLASSLACRLPAAGAAIILLGYSSVALQAVHIFASAPLGWRVAVSILLIAPGGFLMGGCFPVGLRRMAELGRDDALPWMWALNGAASVLASFAAVVISMETTIGTTAVIGAACYGIAAVFLPRKIAATARSVQPLGDGQESPYYRQAGGGTFFTHP